MSWPQKEAITQGVILVIRLQQVAQTLEMRGVELGWRTISLELDKIDIPSRNGLK